MLLAMGVGKTTLRFPGNADFVIWAHGTICIIPTPEAEMHTVRHQLLDQALPRYIAQQGWLVLHASAVRLTDGRSVLFLGSSGDGKSTLAAGFAAYCGGRVLADDCVVVDLAAAHPAAIPNYPGLRLWNDSFHALYPERHGQSAPVGAYSSKRRLAMDGGAETARARPIAAIFVLEKWSDTEDFWCELQSPEKACQGLMHNAFQMDIDNRQTSLRLVAQAMETCRSVPVYALDYPRAYAWLPRAAERILALVNAEPQPNDKPGSMTEGMRAACTR
jgi:hypothetical protein